MLRNECRQLEVECEGVLEESQRRADKPAATGKPTDEATTIVRNESDTKATSLTLPNAGSVLALFTPKVTRVAPKPAKLLLRKNPSMVPVASNGMS